ncbi:MAG: ParB/RepB/Spo0J family partition protein [Clostridia bacterium]|nr:ParB/RepB/Spo0J family partition protein [Clostridia bacterium]
MVDSKLSYIKVADILPSPSQPRRHFDQYELEKLAESIKTSGIVQPLLVRRDTEGKFELIAGERRLRAAKLIGLKKVPCIIKRTDGLNAAYITIIENLQRSDLSAFEEADGINRLITVYGLTRGEVAERLGLAESTLSNKLRLLRLDMNIRRRLEAARLTERHARALLRLPEEKRNSALDVIIAEQMTLTESEKYVEEILHPKPKPEPKPSPVRKGAVGDVRLFANSLTKIVETMRLTGYNAVTEQKETESFIEYRILIPK